MKSSPSIADVQNQKDSRNIAINQVGIRALKHPVQLTNQDGSTQHSVGQFEMTVSLPGDVKGTHMSRFVALLNEAPVSLSTASIPTLLDTMLTRLQATEGRINVSFPFFHTKQAPISKVPSMLDYEMTLTCELSNQQIITTLTAQVPITSLCPCSKQISEYGAHNQRSHVTVSAVVQENEVLHCEDLIALVEAEASCELYGLLKRSDEKYVTERAYDNPKFVEDLVRDVATRLQEHPAVARYKVTSENFESIHNHSAYAVIES